MHYRLIAIEGVPESIERKGLKNKYGECPLNQSYQPAPSFTDERYWLLYTLQEVFYVLFNTFFGSSSAFLYTIKCQIELLAK